MLPASILEALNVYQEAGGEPDDGKAAVARVVRNRMAAKFFSDGTVPGTVLAKDQFSWAYFAMLPCPVSGNLSLLKHTDYRYMRVCSTLEQAQARAEQLLKAAPAAAIMRCTDIASRVAAGTYYSPLYAKLGFDAVSYLNPRICAKLPNWAIPSKLIVTIGRHDFYRR